MMERNWKLLTALFMIFVFGMSVTGSVFADETSEARIEKLEAALKHLQAELAELKAERRARDKINKQEIETVVSKVIQEKKDAMPAVPDWVNSLKLSGDFRFRYESIDAQENGDWQKGVNRGRIRARIGIGADINDELSVGFRFASGSSDPVSTNQTLDDSFSTKDFRLDRAYLDWHPDSVDGLNVYAGKMKNPFYVPRNTELIWDGDLNPEGVAARYVTDLSDSLDLYVNGGGFWINEGDTDSSLWGIQSYLKDTDPDKSGYILGGVSYYDYGNIKGSRPFKTDKFFGNTSENGVYATDFNILELFGEYGFSVCDMPVAFVGDWAKNFAAESGQDTAWLLGVAVNRAKDAGSWRARYNYRDTEENAVFGLFSDSDFAGGDTNSRGSEFGFDYMLTKNVMASLSYFLNERDNNNDDYRRIQADITIKF